jgi:peptidoglycan hydrolase-like protein with peptidoglycan-binding domain
MNKLTGVGLVKFVSTKLNTPYVYGAKGLYGAFSQGQLDSLIKSYPSMYTNSYITKAKKFVGKVCTDCSGLISWYTGKNIGTAQMYSTASKRGLIKDVSRAPIGAVLWKSGHVGVKIDDTYCIEAKGINYGTIKSKISDTKWTHWLLFEDLMSYDAVNSHINTTSKPKNPYKEPLVSVRKGMSGESVKWLQWELIEAGYTKVKVGLTTKTLTIDGEFGDITDTAFRLFQHSSKIIVDGICGKNSINALKVDN